MAATTFTQEFQTSVAPEKMFKALILNAPNTIPKAIPNIVKSIEHEAGPIRKINFTHGAPLKIKIDAVDSQNRICKFTLVEGEMLGNKLESISYEIKYEASSNGGSIINVKGDCRTKGAYSCTADINAETAKAMSLFKSAEAYLLANPCV